MSEGVVALLEPFIDTLVICTMTGLVVIKTGVWKGRLPTELMMPGGGSSYVVMDEHGHRHDAPATAEIRTADGRMLVAGSSLPCWGW